MLNARCARSNWLVDDVELGDLTAEGCSILMDRPNLEVGQAVSIRFAALKGQAGIVRWISDAKAGIQFDEPLDAALIERLTRDHSLGDAKAGHQLRAGTPSAG